MKNPTGHICMLFGILLLLSPEFVFSKEIERRINEDARKELGKSEQETTSKPGGGWIFDYGAWINYRYIEFRDEDNDLNQEDLLEKTHWIESRLWLKATLKPAPDAAYENEHYFYIRAKDLMNDNRPKATAGGWDHDGSHIEYSYVSYDVRPFWLKLGRQYLSAGDGIAYGDIGDGAQLFYLSPQWEIKAFASHTLPHQDNIDTSIPGFDKTSDRYFYGAQCRYEGFSEKSIYGYMVIQRDFSDARPEDPAHDYRYDSRYYGVGSVGTLRKFLSYGIEVIKETGKSSVFETNERKNVDAWAAKCNLEYGPNIYGHPKFLFEYAFGSGDSDRTSVTDTLGGNTSGKDTNFLYFGYLPTSYALFPRLSNLHIYRGGITLTPFEKSNLFKNLSFGVDYYQFYKDKKNGAIYDAEASQGHANVGSEIDATIGWRVFSDLGFLFQYGHFMPGKAYVYPANDYEEYYSVSTTLTF